MKSAPISPILLNEVRHPISFVCQWGAKTLRVELTLWSQFLRVCQQPHQQSDTRAKSLIVVKEQGLG